MINSIGGQLVKTNSNSNVNVNNAYSESWQVQSNPSLVTFVQMVPTQNQSSIDNNNETMTDHQQPAINQFNQWQTKQLETAQATIHMHQSSSSSSSSSSQLNQQQQCDQSSQRFNKRQLTKGAFGGQHGVCALNAMHRGQQTGVGCSMDSTNQQQSTLACLAKRMPSHLSQTNLIQSSLLLQAQNQTQFSMLGPCPPQQSNGNNTSQPILFDFVNPNFLNCPSTNNADPLGWHLMMMHNVQQLPTRTTRAPTTAQQVPMPFHSAAAQYFNLLTSTNTMAQTAGQEQFFYSSQATSLSHSCDNNHHQQMQMAARLSQQYHQFQMALNREQQPPSLSLKGQCQQHQRSLLVNANLNPNAIDFVPSIISSTGQNQQPEQHKQKEMLSNYQKPVLMNLSLIEPSVMMKQMNSHSSSPVEQVRRERIASKELCHLSELSGSYLPRHEALNDYVTKLISDDDGDETGHQHQEEEDDLWQLVPSISTNWDVLDESLKTTTSLEEACEGDCLEATKISDKIDCSKSNQVDQFVINKHRRGSSMSCDDANQSGCLVRGRAHSTCSSFNHHYSMLEHQSSSISLSNQKQQHRPSSFIKLDRYKTELCIYKQEVGQCPYGNSCCFAHGIEEIRPKAPHDNKEKTQPCESYENGVCYRGSSRCWYLHRKPEFNHQRLTLDLRHFLLKQPFRAHLLSADWFEKDYNPILYDQRKYRSCIKNWQINDKQNDIPIDFMDVDLNEHFRFQEKYSTYMRRIDDALMKCLKKQTNSTQDQMTENKTNVRIEYCYDWQSAGTKSSDSIIRKCFQSAERNDQKEAI